MLIRWLDIDGKVTIINTDAMVIIKHTGCVIEAHCAADINATSIAEFSDVETAAKIMDQIVYASMERSPMIDVMTLQVLGQ